MAIEAKTDCLHFNGYKPCRPHKAHGVHCPDCQYFEPVEKKILIIKLQAAGEVVRNTPLLHRIDEEWPNARIYWLTRYPDLIPRDYVHKVFKYDAASTTILRDLEFDIIYSLDKDLEACSLANQIKATVKKGFTQKDGVILPFDDDAIRKWQTGIFDDLMKENSKHYVEEIFEICGFEFKEERYILPPYRVPAVELDRTKKCIALNTGAGPMWKPRIWSDDRWIELSILLIEQGFEVFLLGGKSEDPKNRKISAASGAKYFGVHDYECTMGLISVCDVMVSSVSFCFHLAVGLEKPVILLNNVFNKKEFYLYGR